MKPVGFAFPQSKRLQAILQVMVSTLVLVVLVVMIATEPKPVGVLLHEKPAWFFAAALFFIFQTISEFQLIHILKTKHALEFGEKSLVDRRRFRPREIPYEAIEIFSPEPERLVSTDPRMRDYIAVSARLRDAHPAAAAGDFVFFEKVAPLDQATKTEVLARLQASGVTFGRLIDDQGDDEADT